MGYPAGRLGFSRRFPNENRHADWPLAGNNGGRYGARRRQESLRVGRAAAGQRIFGFAGASDGNARASLSESGAHLSTEQFDRHLGEVLQAERLSSSIEKELQQPAEDRFEIFWNKSAASVEDFHGLPLIGRQKEVLGVLLVGSSRAEVVTLRRRIRLLGAGVAAVGVLFGLLLSWWAAATVTRPVRKLTAGAREVSAGNWNTLVTVRGHNEIGQLARAFNRMTLQLRDQRERAIQAERVAAWREIARRLAHEIEDPLSPLQTTADNLQRARINSLKNSRKYAGNPPPPCLRRLPT